MCAITQTVGAGASTQCWTQGFRRAQESLALCCEREGQGGRPLTVAIGPACVQSCVAHERRRVEGRGHRLHRYGKSFCLLPLRSYDSLT